MTELSDDLLVAYVDGQLARDQSEAIERVLDNDQVAARRVEALKDAHRQLALAFDAMLAGQLAELEQTPPPAEVAPPAEEAPPVEPSDDPSRRAAMPLLEAIPRAGAPVLLGVAAALVLVGGVSGYALRGETAPVATESAAGVTPGWRADVARAHGLLARESLEVGFESQGNLDLVRFQLAKAVGASLVIPDLSGEGLAFKRAQLLRRDGEPFAQIAYLAETGSPVALYAMEGAVPAGNQEPDTVAGVRTAVFATGGISYMLAARLPEETFDKVLWAAKREIVRN